MGKNIKVTVRKVFFPYLKKGIFNFSEQLCQKLVALVTTKSVYSNQSHQNFPR